MSEQPPASYAAQPAPQPATSYASWGDRAVAWLWDVLYMWPTWIAFTVSTVVLVTGIVANERDGDSGVALIVVGLVAFFATTAWAIVRMVRNLMIRQGRTGQTWGKAKVGIWVVNSTGGVPGVGSCVGRYFLHALINQAVYIDYLWPLWDEQKQTLTDKVLSTVVIKPAK
jgi:uncharacterized RDD family membrane protein YckC